MADRTPGRSRQRVLLLVLPILAVALTVGILGPAGVAAYLLYSHFKADTPLAEAAQAPIVMPKRPGPPRVDNPVAPGPAPPLVGNQPEPDQLAPAGLAPGAPAPAQPVRLDVVPDGAAAFVYLEPVPSPPGQVPLDHYQGIVLRELARQCLLLAAREELGLTTRDALLGEAPPPGMPDKNILRVSSMFQMNKGLRIRMTHGPKQTPRKVWDAKAPLGQLNYAAIVTVAELHARTSIAGELRKALGVGKKNRYLPAQTAVPDGIEDLLSELTITSQYQAVRALHAHTRAKGESPGSLGALARAYANLGVLTEFHWSAASRVRKARALLYGARLVKKLPDDTAFGTWHLAYAYALCGMHDEGLVCLKQAAKQQAAHPGKAAPAPPPWLDLIDAYCRYDSARLKQAAGAAKTGRLAELLWYLSVECHLCPTLTALTGEAVLKANPECYRVRDGICRVGGLGVRQVGTLQALAAFAAQFPRRLAALPGLPAEVAKLAGDGPPGPELFRVLREAGNGPAERSEFSWAVLAHLARETHFAQLCGRLDFMRYMWTVPTAEYANQALPSVVGHPYEPFIRTFAPDRYRDVGTCRALLARLPDSEVLPTQLGRCSAYKECRAPTTLRMGLLTICHGDAAEYDLRLTLGWAAGHYASDVPRLSRMLHRISPHAPLGRGLMARLAWNEVSKHAGDWEKQAQHPVLLMFLGEHYLNAKQYEDGIRCLEKSIALAPEANTFKLLAAGYKVAGELDKWQETLDRYLQQPATGLEQARVRVDIANELMRRRLWKRAQPYADAAAQTGADWAMDCASKCYAGLGQWDASEQWIRRCTARYENSYFKWFMWCKRHGRGDLKAATKVVTDRFQDVSQIALPVDLQTMTFFYTLTGRSEQALWVLKSWQKLSPTGDVTNLMLALAQDENEQLALRDRTLKNFPKGSGKSPLLWLPGWYVESLARGEKARPDLNAAEKRLAAMTAPMQPAGAYFVGRFLEQHGHRADAIRYYRRCVEAPPGAHDYWLTLAINRLRALGVKDSPAPGLDV